MLRRIEQRSSKTTLLLLLSLKPLFAGVAKGVDVREVQAILTEFCFNVGPIDGVWGKKTEKAAEEFFTKYLNKYEGYFGHQEFKILKAIEYLVLSELLD